MSIWNRLQPSRTEIGAYQPELTGIDVVAAFTDPRYLDNIGETVAQQEILQSLPYFPIANLDPDQTFRLETSNGSANLWNDLYFNMCRVRLSNIPHLWPGDLVKVQAASLGDERVKFAGRICQDSNLILQHYAIVRLDDFYFWDNNPQETARLRDHHYIRSDSVGEYLIQLTDQTVMTPPVRQLYRHVDQGPKRTTVF